jgi:hypothetical protein
VDAELSREHNSASTYLAGSLLHQIWGGVGISQSPAAAAAAAAFAASGLAAERGGGSCWNDPPGVK